MNKEMFNILYDKIKPIQNKDELYWLINIIKKLKLNTIIEIGVEFGGTLKFWETIINKNGTLIGIDLNPILRWNVEESQKDIILIKGNSTHNTVINKVEEILKNKHIKYVDFLFIDGGHSEDIVTSDYNKYKHFMNVNGIIAFHDINDGNGVEQFWNKLNDNNINKTSFTSKKNGIGIGLICI